VFKAASLAFMLSAASFAGTISFSGGPGVTSGTINPGTTPWLLTTGVSDASSGDFVWSIPGYLGGVTAWQGSSPLIGMSITFSGLSGAFIDTSATSACAGTGVVMCNSSQMWTPQINGLTVTFTPPSADSVAPGGSFFVNIPIAFGNATVPSFQPAATTPFSFTGFFTTADAPEPGTAALLGGALGAIFLVRRRLQARR